MSIKAQVSAQITATQTASLSLGSASASLGAGAAINFANGTGTGNADLVFSGHRTIAASSVDSIDLAGALADAFGATINAARLKAVLIAPDAGNAGDLVVGGGSNPFLGPLGGTTPTVAVRPAGLLLLADPGLGWPVAPGTGDILRISNGSAAAASYQIELVLASA